MLLRLQLAVLLVVVLEVARHVLLPADEALSPASPPLECTQPPRGRLAKAKPPALASVAPDAAVASLPLSLSQRLEAVVTAVAALDVGVEFLTGAFDPVSGRLVPKPWRERYLMPPHSLCFNLAINPALSNLKQVAAAILLSRSPHRHFRLVVWLQPLYHLIEAAAQELLRGRASSRRRWDVADRERAAAAAARLSGCARSPEVRGRHTHSRGGRAAGNATCER